MSGEVRLLFFFRKVSTRFENVKRCENEVRPRLPSIAHDPDAPPLPEEFPALRALVARLLKSFDERREQQALPETDETENADLLFR